MKDSKRFKVFICNIIISVLCLFSIASYFIWPFFKLEVSVAITSDMLDSVLQGMGGEGGDPNASAETDGGSSGDSMTDMLANIDTEAFCADLDPIVLSLELKTADIIAAANTDTKPVVQKIIESNVNNIIDKLDEPISKVVKGAVKEVSKVVVKESIKESVKESIKGSLEESLTDTEINEEVNEILEELNVDETINNAIDSLIDGLSGQDVPVSQATNNIIDTIDDVLTELSESAKNSTSDNPLIEDLKEIKKMTDEDKEMMREELGKMVETFADDNGNVNMDNLLNELLLQFMQAGAGNGEVNGEGNGAGNGEGKLEEGGVSVKVSTLSATYTASDASGDLSGEEQDAKEQLKAELRKMINDAIPDDLVESIAMVMQIISYIIYFTFFTWIWLIFKILMKCRRHCNGIKLKLPIWLGWLPYLILALIPNSAISMLKNPAMLAELGLSLPAEVSGIMSAINISFFNCGFISFYIAIFLLLFGLFYYGPLRRKLKKEAKRMKKEAKAAKKLGYAVAEGNIDSGVDSGVDSDSGESQE